MPRFFDDATPLKFDRDPHWKFLDLRALVDDLFGSLTPQFTAQRIQITIDVPLRLSLTADPLLLRRAILNLSLNARDAMPQGGELVITSHSTPFGLELEIADSGPGLSDEVCSRAFEPFFTTKGRAAGLGLAVVHRIAAAHGGEVIAANCPEGGAAFTLWIPNRRLRAAA